MEKQLIETNIKQNHLTTPCYIFDYDVLNAHIDHMLQISGDTVEFCYAMKANPYLIQEINKKIGKIEVCSPGELEICRHYQILGKDIVFSGVNKTKKDIETAFSYGVDIITIESVKHFNLVRTYCMEHQCEANIILRLTSGAQFGMQESEIRTIIANREEYSMLHILGLHYFTGTQKKKIEKDKEELDLMKDFLNELKEQYHYSASLLEYGLGLSVPYFDGEDFEHVYQDLQDIVNYVNAMKLPYKVVFELGRFITSSCGTYCTTVDDVKVSHGRNFCIVDGGIHQLNYYGQNMAMRVPKISHIKMQDRQEGKREEWCVCGSLCTFADVLVRKIEFNDLESGDILAFHNAGAYSVTEAPALFLSRRMPNIYLYSALSGLQQIRTGMESYEMNHAT